MMDKVPSDMRSSVARSEVGLGVAPAAVQRALRHAGSSVEVVEARGEPVAPYGSEVSQGETSESSGTREILAA